MRKTSIRNKLKHKPQAHARECEENKEKELEEKNDCPLKHFEVKGSIMEGCRRTETPPIHLKIATEIIHSIKVLVI